MTVASDHASKPPGTASSNLLRTKRTKLSFCNAFAAVNHSIIAKLHLQMLAGAEIKTSLSVEFITCYVIGKCAYESSSGLTSFAQKPAQRSKVSGAILGDLVLELSLSHR